ncbi:uncharacterized protein KY384_006439 [Bacidia gigantensis]|uniref:uncharacterized protein n=1 Tax=Bacidia gigantensis TaxID=2732470 RepID=UPI001D03B1C9|nr:uncharacterized protein KY384_006439 [Bacidia gigantensis]KAG8528752.1 hypothetical protein KY384_006439 [Bacidia gigantensis]
MMRSPPPSQSQGSNYAGSPYGGQQPAHGATGQFAPNFNFGGMMNDQTAQIGLQIGQQAMTKGGAYMEQSLNRYVSIPALKHYFNVSTPYVLRKLLLVLFPWRHKPWTRAQRSASSADDVGPVPNTEGKPASNSYQYYFLPPSADLNSPDLYIPTMAVVTYILLTTLLAGLRGQFKPEIMGLTATTAFVVVALEILGLKFGTYILSISNDSQLMDLVAYSGYKFVGVIVTLVAAELINRGQGTGGWAGWLLFGYTFLANAFFLLRSLKYVLLPDSAGTGSGAGGGSMTVARSQRNRRTQFLFLYSYVVQFLFMWILSRADSGAVKAVAPKA